MLRISLREGDYVMIGGNIRVSYDSMNGKDHLVLGIEAPKDIDILRGKLYEEEIEKMAAEGNEQAKVLAEKLKKEYKERRCKYETRRARRDEQARRMASGEIRPYHQWAAEE